MRTGQFVVGLVDEIVGEGGVEVPEFVAIKYELLVLVRHWATEITDLEFDYFIHTSTGSREWRTKAFAHRRLDRLVQVLGQETVDKAYIEAEEVFRTGHKFGDEEWRLQRGYRARGESSKIGCAAKCSSKRTTRRSVTTIEGRTYCSVAGYTAATGLPSLRSEISRSIVSTQDLKLCPRSPMENKIVISFDLEHVAAALEYAGFEVSERNVAEIAEHLNNGGEIVENFDAAFSTLIADAATDLKIRKSASAGA